MGRATLKLGISRSQEVKSWQEALKGRGSKTNQNRVVDAARHDPTTSIYPHS